MFWQVTIVSIGPRPEVDREGGNLNQERKDTKKERVILTLLDRTSTAQGQPVNWFPNQLSRLARASTDSAFWPRKPIFFTSFLF